ncbi:hypothetical protein F5144DRAFT_609231 [Chaetomium tenue]|uniref:Uncharacterized protein n=1 Tax=Chaetomium tenue TaxID=1854479 RepID=A0ACB7PIF9_9PEZI|nr:hypothetical protein F5144DRAFT_609231 [Chaetomium globosum]
MDGGICDPTLHGAVRSYSLLVAEERPGDTLSQALGANASDQALLRLENHKRHVAERWQTFDSEHQHLQLDGVFGEDHGPPRLDGLLRAVQDAEAAWERKKGSGIGKTKQAIENFMGAMNNHSYLFSIIPSGDKYTSLITGVMTSMTKAFVNHKKIAESFSEGLETITKDLETVQASVKISDTLQMRRLVVDLYVALFDFLCDAMDWYKGGGRRRLFGSFRQDYTDNIRKSTGKVKEALTRIRVEAEQATQFRVQDTQQGMLFIRDGIGSMSQEIRIMKQLIFAGDKDRVNPTATRASLDDLDESSLLVLGREATRTLVANGESQRAVGCRQPPRHGRTLSGEDDVVELWDDDLSDGADRSHGHASSALGTAFSYTRAGIQDAFAPHLECYLEDGRSEVLTSGGSISTFFLPSEVTQKRAAPWLGRKGFSLQCSTVSQDNSYSCYQRRWIRHHAVSNHMYSKGSMAPYPVPRRHLT